MKIEEEIVETLIKRFETLIEKCENYQEIIFNNDNKILISNTSIDNIGANFYIYYKGSERFKIDSSIYLSLKNLATNKRLELLLNEIKE